MQPGALYPPGDGASWKVDTVPGELSTASPSGNLPFIPRQMDDAGLTPAQFRIVCRVSRRGVCSESIENMAKGCRLAVNTIKAALPFLVLRNVLSKEKRTGQTSIYRVKPPDQWRIEPSPKDTPAQKTAKVVKLPTPSTKRHPSHLAQKTPHKGSPLKGIPLRVHANSPHSFIPD